MKTTRLSKTVEKLLNEQVQNELVSSQLYLSISNCANSKGLFGAEKFFMNKADEERTHMMKIVEYLKDKGSMPVTPSCPELTKCYSGIKEVMTLSLEHERMITGKLNNIYTTALAEKDNVTVIFMHWFLNEQIEEEGQLMDLISQLEILGETGVGVMMFDELLSDTLKK